MYFWWQAGASIYLQEKGDLKPDVKVQGGSAGSLTAAMLVTKSNFKDAATFAIMQARRENIWSNPKGLAGVWSDLTEEWLENIIPDTVNAESLSSLHITATPWSLRRPKILNDFVDKSDVIDACMVSVHIPLFMDGKVSRKYKGKKYIDGCFLSYITKGIIRAPTPKGVSKDSIFTVSFHEDEDFMKKSKGNSIVSLITPERLYEMMDAGYEFMRRADEAGKVPDLFQDTLSRSSSLVRPTPEQQQQLKLQQLLLNIPANGSRKRAVLSDA